MKKESFVTCLALLGLAAVTDPAHAYRVCGHVAERPDDPSAFARGVEVTLNPVGAKAVVEPLDPHFCFDDVPAGNYTLSVSPRCNPFGCRPESTAITVIDEDLWSWPGFVDS